MSLEHQTTRAPLFKAQKGFEGKSAFFCWSGSVKANGKFHKCHLIVDAEQKTFGVRLTTNKPENLNPTGGVVAQIRKHAKSPAIGQVLLDQQTGDWWLALYLEPGVLPDFWLRLQAGYPPELSLIDKNNLIYIRKSSQGTFTKKRTWEGTLPDSNLKNRFRLMNSDLLEQLLQEFVAEIETESGDQDSSMTQDASQSDNHDGLPDYQREARDRLSRRLKTIKKSAEKTASPEKVGRELRDAEQTAELTRTWLHRLKPEDHFLDLSFLPEVPPEFRTIEIDPEKSPGANLEQMFVRIKKLKKTILVSTRMQKDQLQEIAGMEADLARLRAGAIDLKTTEDILQRYKLLAKKQTGKKVISPKHSPWRTYYFQDLKRKIPFFIGKSAADNDELCKKARSNDTWMHAVGVTGSHVIIPAKEAGATPHADLIRTAGILALHFSKIRDDQRGEVYVSKRQHIRKQKGMAPGLWAVDKAESLFIKYDQNDLQLALDLAAP